jgi:RNA-directed DNA polymerase
LKIQNDRAETKPKEQNRLGGSNQTALIAALNPHIRGWANYHRTCSAKNTFHRMDHQLHWKLSK